MYCFFLNVSEVFLSGGKNSGYGNTHKTSCDSVVILKQFKFFIYTLSLETLKILKYLCYSVSTLKNIHISLHKQINGYQLALGKSSNAG